MYSLFPMHWEKRFSNSYMNKLSSSHSSSEKEKFSFEIIALACMKMCVKMYFMYCFIIHTHKKKQNFLIFEVFYSFNWFVYKSLCPLPNLLAYMICCKVLDISEFLNSVHWKTWIFPSLEPKRKTVFFKQNSQLKHFPC